MNLLLQASEQHAQRDAGSSRMLVYSARLPLVIPRCQLCRGILLAEAQRSPRALSGVLNCIHIHLRHACTPRSQVYGQPQLFTQTNPPLSMEFAMICWESGADARSRSCQSPLMSSEKALRFGLSCRNRAAASMATVVLPSPGPPHIDRGAVLPQACEHRLDLSLAAEQAVRMRLSVHTAGRRPGLRT